MVWCLYSYLVHAHTAAELEQAGSSTGRTESSPVLLKHSVSYSNNKHGRETFVSAFYSSVLLHVHFFVHLFGEIQIL